MIALTGARLVDGTGSPARDGVTVVVERGRISAVGDQPAPPDAPTVDIEGRTLMPGLIDAHVHLSSLDRSLGPELHPYGLVEAARGMLLGGITTVRDLGSFGRSLFDLRDAIERGLVPGPRLVLCGQIVAASCPGGRTFPGMYREADGPDEMRKALREQIRQGADFVKIMSTGALTVVEEDIGPTQLTRAEIDAIVEETHRLGFKVASHAEGSDGIRLSVEAGVDTLEHGEMGWEVPDVLTAMAERGIILVPTLCVFDAVARADSPFLPWMRERAERLRESSRKTMEIALAAGVQMAMGADAGPHGENARELVLMVEAGMPASDGIVAATSMAARACGLEDEIGTVEVGKRADLLVVDGDPLEDVRVVADRDRIWLVLKDGERVAGSAPVLPTRGRAES